MVFFSQSGFFHHLLWFSGLISKEKGFGEGSDAEGFGSPDFLESKRGPLALGKSACRSLNPNSNGEGGPQVIGAFRF
ncbi:hypothetical protein U1Q18_010679 [Sarracenia purpurea var. burkii]